MRTIWKRELKGYFLTPVGYVFIGVFLTVASVLFYLEILARRSGDLPSFIASLCYLWMLLSPAAEFLYDQHGNSSHGRKSGRSILRSGFAPGAARAGSFA